MAIMMVVVDTKKNKAYQDVTYTEAGEIIGVSDKSISRWGKKTDKHGNQNKIEVYNHFHLYYDVEVCPKRKKREKRKKRGKV